MRCINQVKAGVIRSAALLPDKLIATANGEVAIRLFEERLSMGRALD
jgi:hypothetical protein